MKPEQQKIAIAEACGQTIPDYLTDLNAMHEAEKVIPLEKWVEYVKTLAPGTYGERGVSHASASQRAEAFLKTLGLWK